MNTKETAEKATVQTAIICTDPAEGTIRYHVVPGDWSQFHEIIINVSDSPLAGVLGRWDDNYTWRHEPVPLSDFVSAIREGAIVIECGFCS